MFERHQAGPRLLHRAVRAATTRSPKYDQVFVPEFSAGAMENVGLRDLLRAAAVPVQGHRHDVRAAGDGDPARDGAHVVRRLGHHEVVGRPVAQRVVRRVLRGPVQRRGHPVHRRLDHVLRRPQDLGLHAGPAALHAPDRGRRADPERGDRELRRHQLRQGRLGAQAAGGLRRPGQLLRRHPGLLRRARLGQRHARPTCWPRWRPARAGPGRLVEGVAGDRRARTPCAASSSSARTGRSPRSRSCRRRRPSTRTLRPHHIAVGLYNRRRTARWCARTGSRSTSPGRGPRCRSWPACRSRTWSCSTTTTSATR